MKNEVYHNIFIFNSQLMEKDLIDSISYSDGIVVYEVIRVIDGIPLFLEDHLMRLHYSANLAGFNIGINDSEINNSIKQLSVENQTYNGTVKLLFQYKGNQKVSFLCFFIEHNYPSDLQYKNGVKVLLHAAERINPNAKLINNELHQSTEDIIAREMVYEVLLVNKTDRITEGSKSNVFFIRDNKLFTAPKKLVLPGITRKFVMKIAHLSGFEVIEECVIKKDIEKYDAVFLSGTSPKILPVSSIENFKFSVEHPLMEKLMKEFDEEIENYIYRFS